MSKRAVRVPLAAPCPCGTGATYKTCCAPYHRGTHAAPTPEKLMRARYSAYATGEVRYIMDTTHPDSPYYQADRKAWFKALQDYVNRVQFLGLRVMSARHADDVGYVRFRATLMQGGRDASFEENSRFARVDGVWLYVARE